MFKKLLIASAVLAVSSSIAFAYTSSAPYVGGSIGARVNTASGNNSNHRNRVLFPTTTTTTTTGIFRDRNDRSGGSSNATSVAGTLVAGYHYVVDTCWSLGGEVFIEGDANTGNSKCKSGRCEGERVVPVTTPVVTNPLLALAVAKEHRNRNRGNATARTTWAYGLDIVPGYMITPTVMSYVKVGVERDRFSSAGNNATGVRLGLGTNQAKVGSGLRFGQAHHARPMARELSETVRRNARLSREN